MTEIIGWLSSAMAVFGVVLNNRRIRVCFLLWIASNSASAGIHAMEHMWYYAARDLVFLVLAVDGWYRWRVK